MKKEFYYLSKFHNGDSFYCDSNYKVTISVYEQSAKVVIADLLDYSPTKLMNFIEPVATDLYYRYLSEHVSPTNICWIHENPYIENAYMFGKTKFSIVTMNWSGKAYNNPEWMEWHDSIEMLNLHWLI